MSGVIGFVFARGGSKGVKNKNLRELAGKTLLAHAIIQAQAADAIERVIVSTDSDAIAEEALKFGAEVPFMRPSELAGDDAPEWLAWRHALEQVNGSDDTPVDPFVSVSPTAPLRSPADIDACVERYQRGGVDVVITATEARRSPHFNMVTLAGDGMATLVIPPDTTINRRQEAPDVFDMTTVCYAVDPRYLMEADDMLQGRVGAVLVPPERALDIDSELDLKIAEALIT